ncbi:MAG: sigma-70 family RNA polymerase sigma factor, partial [Pseudoxanthomonas sp.]
MHTLPLDLQLREALPAAAAGDAHAYSRVVLACQNTITAVALAITRDVHASEDIAQEAFLKGWRQLGTLKNPDSFLPWLREITRNLARDHLRAQRHRPMTGDTAELAITLAADTAPTPAETLLQTEQEDAARNVISALPEDSREVLLLYYREGQNAGQVARLLGLSDVAVRKRLSRARLMVRAEMLARFGEFARASAPSAAFASVLFGLLTVAAPPAAAASILASGSVVAGKGLMKLMGASLGAIAFACVAGISAIWLGIRKPLMDPLDRKERNALIAYGVLCTLMVMVFVAGITALARLPGWIPHVALSLAYMIGISWASGRWLPRILNRRRQRRRPAERARRPAAGRRPLAARARLTGPRPLSRDAGDR